MIRTRLPALLSSLALATTAFPAQSVWTEPAAPRETKDRLAPERMEALVAGPIRAAVRGDLPRAQSEFERLVGSARRRHGKASVREADLVTSFAIQLYVQGGDLDREDMRKLSAIYLARAVDASRSAFGPRHPETAVTLHTHADALVELATGEPPEQAEAAMAEAYSIRLAALGAENIETLAAMRGLARVKAARSGTGGKLEEAVELFRRAIEISARSKPEPDHLRADALRMALVEAYLENGRSVEGLREAKLAFDEAAREQAVPGADGISCTVAAVEAISIAGKIEAKRPADAEALRRLFAPQNRCFEPIDPPEKDAAAKG